MILRFVMQSVRARRADPKTPLFLDVFFVTKLTTHLTGLFEGVIESN